MNNSTIISNFSNASEIINITSKLILINELNNKKKKRIPKYFIFSDNLVNKYCSDINAFIVFEYFLKNNLTDAYYIINIYTDLYKFLVSQNKTKNLLLLKKKNYNNLFEYFLNSKIIISSYENNFHKIVNEVSYLKFLYINHGITYFKSGFIKPELYNFKKNKRNIISSSPFEFSILLKKFNYSENYIYKAGLARYDMYNKPKKNFLNKKCILVFFTYRRFNNSFFQKSLYKINLENFFNDESLIEYLKKNNIDLIFAQHHVDRASNKIYNITSVPNVKIVSHFNLTIYISQCSLLVTDFSSVSFAFMFQNKPTLFYLIDYDNNKVHPFKKKFFRVNDPLQFGNCFLDKYTLIKKIKYYIRKNFSISNKLKKNYESVFYFKYNITERIYKIIMNCIK